MYLCYNHSVSPIIPKSNMNCWRFRRKSVSKTSSAHYCSLSFKYLSMWNSDSYQYLLDCYIYFVLSKYHTMDKYPSNSPSDFFRNIHTCTLLTTKKMCFVFIHPQKWYVCEFWDIYHSSGFVREPLKYFVSPFPYESVHHSSLIHSLLNFLALLYHSIKHPFILIDLASRKN